MTGKEVCDNIKKYFNDQYVYWYGGKGQECSEPLLANLSALYPAIYTAGYTAKCRDDIKAKKRCIDCSGLVCRGYKIADIGTYTMATDPRFSEYEGKPENGMILWRWTHVGIYIDGKVWEARGKNYGLTNSRDYSPQDWQRVLVMASVDYADKTRTPLEYLEEAIMTVKGYNGNGDARVKKLSGLGYDAGKIQRIINEAYKNG